MKAFYSVVSKLGPCGRPTKYMAYPFYNKMHLEINNTW